MRIQRLRNLAAPLMLALLAAGCGGDDDDSPGAGMDPVRYEVQATNLTAGQPLSPVAAILHQPGYRALAVGDAASVELERLAEGGDNSELLAAADAMATVNATASGSGPIGPGSSETVELEATANTVGSQRLTLVTMLVNTNDAIGAVSGIDVSGLAAGESLTVQAKGYDSGTEANTETADTIPGPAASGGAQEGFNAARDDVRDAVHGHPGVVTADDGLATSVLGDVHRWDNPVVRVTITRTQ